MIVIADSGSTKTDWLVFSNSGMHARFSTPGLNPYFIETSNIGPLIHTWIAPHLPRVQVTELYFYGAGCQGSTIGLMEDVLRYVFPTTTTLEVHVDLLAAAKALLGNEAGFAAILGTGTNSCLYDGERITHHIDSLGFLLGDEGSGATIGKRILSDFLRRKLPDNLREDFIREYAMDEDQVIDQVYRSQQANRFCASFAKFLDIPHMDESYRHEVVSSAFRSFFTGIVCLYPSYDQFDLNCVGSIAYRFEDILAEVAASHGMSMGKVIPSVIEELAYYHGFRP